MAKDKKEKKNAEVEEVKAEEVTEEVTEEPGQEEAADERDAKIESLEKELAAQKDKYMRLAAEYDNYRKRTANEKLSIYDDATGKAVTELLPVADSVRMALENLKDADAEIIKGVELIQTQLGRSFEKLKITGYGAVGDTFDPQLHNAISMVDSDELESGQIAAVFQTGYKIGDKIIRHAMVQVVN
ncbi:molecular chaperone GrpE [Ruminococcaceae bacterium P7]|nr:molecular chaperone GrpE [Ruminococcaceae bacterium P7]